MSATGSNAAVARRYARALVELCDERSEQGPARAAVERLAAVFEAVPESVDHLANPTVRGADRRALLDELLKHAGVDGTVANFCRLLLDKGRFRAFAEISAAFVALLDERVGRIQAHVDSAVPLNDEVKQRLRAVLGKALGREVDLSTSVDADLIGGLRVRVGNTIYDTSVRNHLERLRARLLATV